VHIEGANIGPAQQAEEREGVVKGMAFSHDGFKQGLCRSGLPPLFASFYRSPPLIGGFHFDTARREDVVL
jgi:hypothetical protein